MFLHMTSFRGDSPRDCPSFLLEDLEVWNGSFLYFHWGEALAPPLPRSVYNYDIIAGHKEY